MITNYVYIVTSKRSTNYGKERWLLYLNRCVYLDYTYYINILEDVYLCIYNEAVICTDTTVILTSSCYNEAAICTWILRVIMKP